MSLFGKYDRRTAHDRTDRITTIQGHKDFNTGREIKDRIKGKIEGKHVVNRKLLQQNFYRIYRGQGYGIWESYKMAKSKAAQEMISQHFEHRYHKHHHKH